MDDAQDIFVEQSKRTVAVEKDFWGHILCPSHTAAPRAGVPLTREPDRVAKQEKDASHP